MKSDQKSAIPALCEHVAALCDILRETRLEIEVLTVIPAPAAKLTELRLREENCLYLLREARVDLVTELEAA